VNIGAKYCGNRELAKKRGEPHRPTALKNCALYFRSRLCQGFCCRLSGLKVLLDDNFFSRHSLRA
jgi:hypothetical protein